MRVLCSADYKLRRAAVTMQRAFVLLPRASPQIAAVYSSVYPGDMAVVWLGSDVLAEITVFLHF